MTLNFFRLSTKFAYFFSQKLLPGAGCGEIAFSHSPIIKFESTAETFGIISVVKLIWCESD